MYQRASGEKLWLKIDDRQHFDLASVLQERFTVSQFEDLSITEASGLINSLKGAGNGAGGGR